MIHDYPILTNWLRESIQETVPIVPEACVVHSTANPGATDEDHVNWLNQKRQAGWANYYLDHDSIRQVAPEGWRAPAQGPTYNLKALSLEMCEPSLALSQDEQKRRFWETWNRSVWLVANRCRAYGWDVSHIRNHAQISAELPNETDHQDPLAFFARYGKTWGDFVADVGWLLDDLNGALPSPAPWQTAFIDQLMQAGLITQRRHPLQPVQFWELAALLLRVLGKG